MRVISASILINEPVLLVPDMDTRKSNYNSCPIPTFRVSFATGKDTNQKFLLSSEEGKPLQRS
jgi:hypothetical protein